MVSSIYNAYFPQKPAYEPISEPEEEKKRESFFSSLFRHEKNAGDSGIFQKLKLDRLDSGDLLLLLILFLLLREGDHSDAVIALALAAIFLLDGDS